MPTKDGSKIQSGVTWTYDSKTLTVTMILASCGKYTGKRVKKTWKNECPYCKKKGWDYKGKLYPHGSIGRKVAPEGEITCKRCDTDFDGVSGKSKEGKCKYSLTKALAPTTTTSSSTTSVTATSNQEDKKKAINEIRTKFNDRVKPKTSFKVSIPPLQDLSEGEYIEIRPPLIANPHIFFIGDVDSKDDTMDLTLYDRVPEPSNPYQAPTASSSSAPTSTGTTSTSTSSTANSKVAYKKVSGTSKSVQNTMMLLGKKLKTKKAIWDWLHAGGSAGFKYLGFENWGHRNWNGPNGHWDNWIMKKRWNVRKMNCVTFSWAYHLMCKGAGIKMAFLTGQLWTGEYWGGHAWNRDSSGKYWELTSESIPNIPHSYYRLGQVWKLKY